MISKKLLFNYKKKCPYCFEKINNNAIKCKHCGEWINPNDEYVVDELKVKKVKKVKSSLSIYLKNIRLFFRRNILLVIIAIIIFLVVGASEFRKMAIRHFEISKKMELIKKEKEHNEFLRQLRF